MDQLQGWKSAETWSPVRISVKGDGDETALAMARRGIAGRLVETRGGRTYWDVPEGLRPVLVAWYCEPAVCSEGTGFPAGTLLHHG